MNVHILASCRRYELVKATLLVFDTIRKGFPTAKIFVQGNQLDLLVKELVGRACRKVNAKFVNCLEDRHDNWVRNVIMNEDQPTVICDTDMIFYENMEPHFPLYVQPWAGRYTPEYFEPWSRTVYRSRLHTSLLFIRPDELRDLMLRFDGKFPKQPFFPRTINFIGQQLQPVVGKPPYFCDTGANLYQAIGGDAFGPATLDCYSHLNAGTWSDLIGKDLTAFHEAVYADPEIARGLWRKQDEFYAAHPSPI